MDYRTPGVHVEHVLTEPTRVLRTGVPVFLGLIRKEELEIHNALQDDDDERFIQRLIPGVSDVSVARKKGYLRLPERPSEPLSDSLAAVPRSYLQAAYPNRPASPSNVAQARATAGAGGQTGGRKSGEVETPQLFSLKPQRFTVWPQFEASYGSISPCGYLTYAVRGFFENYGNLCYVQLICFQSGNTDKQGYNANKQEAIRAGLSTLEVSNDYDLVCVPDIMWGVESADSEAASSVYEMQSTVIEHCQRLGDRFAILDSIRTAKTSDVKAQRQRLSGDASALYFPWLRVDHGPGVTDGYVPPCGHVAGVYARSDTAIGVHKAPANEVLEGVLDLAINLTDEEQGELNPDPVNINCIRSFPRRGIRVWGARTLSPLSQWRYVNVRRVFITAARWIERNMTDVVFEPNTPELWARIERDLTFYFADLLAQGGLAGTSAREAFYVKCDAETNPPEFREQGKVVTEIGLAPAAPAEFIIVRIIQGQTGVSIIGPR